MFEKFKKVMKLNEGKQPNDEEWNEGLERNGGLEKNDFLAMLISAMIMILPICLILLILITVICSLFLL